ncbi:CHK kinase-like domain-containing protein [Caenorhabditis elegans]|nr:CHK kinase-like domain-containing protein [Caenorhabditis elegans]CAJ80810.1 CHK kinase-like domain-containing protein [Caenorhabditis elegans]|eukprot:NP_001040949.1 Uncharacterized protein CELE_F49C12.7 [Caenorhabditis elegans]
MLKTAELADGLLGTTLQWEDVQKIAEESAGHNLKIGEKKTIKPLAEGVGLQSLLGIAEIDWEVEGDDKAPYPNKFALKIGSPVALLQALEAQAAKLPPDVAANISDEFISFLPPCHNSENYFYKYIQSLPKLDILPDFYFGNQIELEKDGNYSKGCIAIELVEDIKTLSPLENFSDDQMLQVLDALAKLQVQFINLSEDKRREAPHQGLSGLYSPFKDWFLQLNNGLMALFPDPEMQKLTETFATTLPEIITADELDLVPCKLGMKKVFVHGDLWSANIMWNQEGHLKKLIDFQMIHFGLAATDLARVMNTCLSPEERHANKEKYLKHYFDCLTKHCKEDDHPVPFDLEQLTTTYNLAYPRVSAYLLPALTAVLEKVVSMPNIPAKPMVIGSFISKVKGIYSDIIATHESRPEI